MLFKPRHFALWFVVCWLAALPSFLLGLQTKANPLAMTLGVMIFVLGYTALSTTLYAWLSRRPIWMKTVRAAFVLRLLTALLQAINFLLHFDSALYVLLLMLDGWSGIFALMATELLTGPSIMLNHTHIDGLETDPFLHFMQTLLATILQGIIQNIIIALCAAALFPIIALWRRLFRKENNTESLQK